MCSFCRFPAFYRFGFVRYHLMESKHKQMSIYRTFWLIRINWAACDRPTRLDECEKVILIWTNDCRQFRLHGQIKCEMYSIRIACNDDCELHFGIHFSFTRTHPRHTAVGKMIFIFCVKNGGWDWAGGRGNERANDLTLLWQRFDTTQSNAISHAALASFIHCQ